MLKIKASLSCLNYKLYFALLFLGFCPALYTTIRIFFLGQLPDTYAYSIAGQLNWLGLLYEILNEAILLPLYYFCGQVSEKREEFTKRLATCLLLTALLYSAFSLFIIVDVKDLLSFMAVDPHIFQTCTVYIRLESIAAVFNTLCSVTLIALVSLKCGNYLYLLTVARLILNILGDTLLVSSWPCSLRLGVIGIALTNIAVNVLLLGLSFLLLNHEKIKLFQVKKLSFAWLKEFFKVGSLSGLESLVRNLAYLLMIVRMVNTVNEQGVYWVANSFIWSWLLLPILQLAELIKQEVATEHAALHSHMRGYFLLTALICLLWLAGIPLWRPFMTYVLGYTEVEKLFGLVLLLLGFYILFAFQNVFDSVFYALGKTNYMLFESIVTNSCYYGCAYFLYLKGLWLPDLTGIALLFGGGIAFDSLVSLTAYLYLLHKEKICI